MATRKQSNKHAGTGHVCGDCARGELSQKQYNRTAQGNPFVKYCPFSNWARNKDGQKVSLISTPACENYKPK